MRKNDVYWWSDAPLMALEPKPVPAAADVVIVGAGYTGLAAAIRLARAGRSVQVFDRQRPGEGASTRNGGITSGNLRPGHAELAKRFGEDRAAAILAEAKAAREDLYRFIAEERIDCDFALTGRFSGASAPGDYDRLARDAEALNRTFGIEAYAVPRSEQRAVLGTDFYHGGAVRMDIGGLHPAKFHAGLLRLALAAGAAVHGETAIQGIRSERDGHEVATARGTIRARDVIVGVNGYADASDRWLRRRLVPVRSRIIATAPLSANLMGELMPRRMMCSETRKLHYYYRPSPGRRAHPVRRPRRHDRRRSRLADREPETGPRRHLSRARRRRDHAQLVRPCRHEPRHGSAHLLAARAPLCRGLLRIGRGVGALGRGEGGKADPRRGNADARRWISARRALSRSLPARPGSCRRSSPGSRCRTGLRAARARALHDDLTH